MQYVIRTSDNKVLRYGMCDFYSDGSYDATNEYIITTDDIITGPHKFDCILENWYWNDGQFQKE